MASLRGAAFVCGAIGLALFLGGILWAFVAPSDDSCPDRPELRGIHCERHNYGLLLGQVMWVVGGGLVAEGVAVVLLLLHLSQRRPSVPARRPAPVNGTLAPNGATPAQPLRNRFLEPPVPPRNGGKAR